MQQLKPSAHPNKLRDSKCSFKPPSTPLLKSPHSLGWVHQPEQSSSICKWFCERRNWQRAMASEYLDFLLSLVPLKSLLLTQSYRVI